MKRLINLTCIIWVLMFFMLLVITACGDSGTDAVDNTGNPVVKEFNGRLEKGPFQKGAGIKAYAWDDTLGFSGESFATTTVDDLGNYSLKSSKINGCLYIEADGYYYNENSDVMSDSKLMLYGMVDSTKIPWNINILTHIIKDKVMDLLEDGQTYDDAVENAILALFTPLGWSPIDPGTQSVVNNANLLFLSAAICKNRNVAEVSALLTKLTKDIKDNTLDLTILYSSFQSLDIAEVTANMTTKYGYCPDIASVKSQILTKLGLVDSTIRIVTVQPVASAEFYIFTNGKTLHGFRNNTIESINTQYIQQYLGVTETLNASINDFFSVGAGAAKVLYFSVTLPDSVTKIYSQTYAGVLTEIASLPANPVAEVQVFNDGEFMAFYDVGKIIVQSLGSANDMTANLLYGYYKTDNFIVDGVDRGKGIFLVWTNTVNWLSYGVAGSYHANIAGAARMW